MMPKKDEKCLYEVKKRKGVLLFFVDWFFQCFHRIDEHRKLSVRFDTSLSFASSHNFVSSPRPQVIGVAKDAPQVSRNRDNA